jgi:hypothetical protein
MSNEAIIVLLGIVTAFAVVGLGWLALAMRRERQMLEYGSDSEYSRLGGKSARRDLTGAGSG